LEIKEKGAIGQKFCKHDYQEGIVEGIVSGPKAPAFFNISGDAITAICVKCGKIKGSYFRKNTDGS
jgi:hypothetical protein